MCSALMWKSGTLRTKIGARMGSFLFEDDKKSILMINFGIFSQLGCSILRKEPILESVHFQKYKFGLYSILWKRVKIEDFFVLIWTYLNACKSNKGICTLRKKIWLNRKKLFVWKTLWIEEKIYLNKIKFVWFKQNIFEPNKNLFTSIKFLP